MLIPFSRRFRTRFPWFARTFLLTASFLFSFVVGFAYASWAMVCRAGRCPSANALDSYEPRQTSKIYAADGRFIAELRLEPRARAPFDRAARPGAAHDRQVRRHPAARSTRLRHHRGPALLQPRRHR